MFIQLFEIVLECERCQRVGYNIIWHPTKYIVQLSPHFQTEENNFIPRIVVIDKTWVWSNETEIIIKKKNTEWHTAKFSIKVSARARKIKDDHNICLWYPQKFRQPLGRDWHVLQWSNGRSFPLLLTFSVTAVIIFLDILHSVLVHRLESVFDCLSTV